MDQPGAGGGSLYVHLCDNGPGIDASIRDRVFQPFFTTKAKGTGLGMAIAARAVEAHGGSLELGGDWSEGAEFVLRLPIENPLTATAATPPRGS